MKIRYRIVPAILIMASSVTFASDPAPEPAATPATKAAIQPAPKYVKAPKIKRPLGKKNSPKKALGTVVKLPASALPRTAIVPGAPQNAHSGVTENAENRWKLYSYP